MVAPFSEERFPLSVAFGTSGGPERRTDIVRLSTGYENRNQRTRHSWRRYDAGSGVKSLADLIRVLDFFEARRGRLVGFRFRDPFDAASARWGQAATALDQPRQGEVQEGPGHGGVDGVLADAVLAQRRTRAQPGLVQGTTGCAQLPLHPLLPGRMALVFRPQVALVNQLHRLLGQGQRQAAATEGGRPRGMASGSQLATAAGEMLGVVQDQRRIHQPLAVQADQRGRLEHRIEAAKALDLAKQRHLAQFEGQHQQAQGDRDSPHIGGVKHANELHGGILSERVNPVSRGTSPLLRVSRQVPLWTRH